MELALRRRVIYTGMRPFFDDLELLNAINLWQTEYSDKPKFALNVFVARSCNTPQLKAQRSNILRAIFIAMDMAEDELLADPFDEISTTGKLASLAEQGQDHKTQVFVKLLEQLFLKLNEQDEKTVRDFLLEHLNEIKTDKRRLSHLKEWFSLNTKTLAANYDLESMQKLINLSYIAICNLTGPVKADQYLALSIKETEGLSIKVGFKTHDLL